MPINKVDFAGQTLIDLTGDTVSPETLMEGATAHDKAGNPIKGTAKPGSGGKQVQSDWAENDPKSPAYVKNRFGGYVKNTKYYFLPEQIVQFSDMGGMNGSEVPNTETLHIGDAVFVKWDGVVYAQTVIEANLGVPFPAVGNVGNIGAGANTGEPFLIVATPDAWTLVSSDSAASHTVGVYTQSEISMEIPRRYLPRVYIDKKLTNWDSGDWLLAEKALKAGKLLFFKESDFYNQVFSLEASGHNALYSEKGILTTYENGDISKLGAHELSWTNSMMKELNVNMFGSAGILVKNGLTLCSPNGSFYKLFVDDSGTISSQKIT